MGKSRDAQQRSVPTKDRRDSRYCAAPLAVPETAYARCRSRRFDRSARVCSLFPPQAAVAHAARTSGARVRAGVHKKTGETRQAVSPESGGEGGTLAAAQPLLRCPKRPMLAAARAVSTAAPASAPCLRRRRRSHTRPAPPALGFEPEPIRKRERHVKRSLPNLAEKEGLSLLRSPSCGARNGLCSLPLAPFRPLRPRLLPVSAAGGGRTRGPRLRRSGSSRSP